MQANTNNTTVSLKRSQARNFFLARDYGNAEKLLQSILNEYPDLDDENFLEIQKLLGTLYIRTKRFDESLQVWKKINERFPKNVEALINLAVVYRNIKQYDNAIHVLNEAKALAGENDEILFNEGSVYKDSGNYAQAIDAFQKLVKLKPDDALAYNYLGTVYLLSGDNASASYYYKKGLQVDPNHPFLNYNLANIYKEERAFTEALAFYNAALRVNPNWSDVLHCIAEIYTAEGNISEAINFEKAIIKTEGETERACVALADLYLKLNDESEAERYYKKALAINPKSEKAVLGVCEYLLAKNDIAEALRIFTNAKNAGIESEAVLLLYANTCLRVKDFAVAKEIIQKLYQKNKNSIEVLKLYGKLFSLLGQRESAEKIFLQILQKAPSEIGLRFDLATQYYESGDYQNARIQLERYLIEKPRDTEAQILLGKCYEKIKLFDKAQKQYEAVLKDDPKNLPAMTAFSQFLQKHGNVLDAVMMADKMINLQSERGTQDDLQSLAESLKLYEKATEKFNAQKPSKPSFLRQANEPKQSERASASTHIEEEEESFSLTEETGEEKKPLAPEDLNMPFNELVELSDEEETWNKDNPIEEHRLENIVDVDSPIVDTPFHDESIPGFGAVSRDAAFSSPFNQGSTAPAQFAQNKNNDDYVLPQVQEEPQFAAPSSDDDDTVPYSNFNGRDDFELPDDTAIEEKKEPKASSRDDALARAEEQLTQQNDLIDNLNKELENFKLPDADERERKAEEQLAKQSELIDDLNEKLNNLKSFDRADEQREARERFDKQNELLDKLNDKLSALDLPLYDDEQKDATERLEKQSELIDALNKKLDDLKLPEYNTLQESDAELEHQKALLEKQLDQLDELNDTLNSYDDILKMGQTEKADFEKPQTIEDAIGSDLYRSNPELDDAGFLPYPKKVPVGKIKEQVGFEQALKTISSEEMLQLFKNLRELMAALPPEESKKFLVSDERMKTQYIIKKLSGSVGLRMRAIFMKMRNFLQNPNTAAIEADVTVKSLLEYLRDMAEALPDKGFSDACVSKLDTIIENIE